MLTSLAESLVTARASEILEGMLLRGFTTVRDCGEWLWFLLLQLHACWALQHDKWEPKARKRQTVLGSSRQGRACSLRGRSCTSTV